MNTQSQLEYLILGWALRSTTHADQVLQRFQPEDLSSPQTRDALSVLKRLRSNDEVIDWVVVAEKLSPHTFDAPLATVGDWVLNAAGLSNVDDLCDRLLSDKGRKRLSSRLLQLSNQAAEGQLTLPELIRSVDHALSVVRDTTRGVDASIVSASNIKDSMTAEVERVMRTPFVGTGYGCLDSMLTWGFAPGQLSIISARPNVGKSAFRANITLNLAVAGIPSTVYSFEQSVFSEWARFFGIRYRVEFGRIRNVHDWFNNEDSPLYKQYLAFLEEVQHTLPIRVVRPVGPYSMNSVEQDIIKSLDSSLNTRVVFMDLFSQVHDVAKEQVYTVAAIQNAVDKAANIAIKHNVHMSLLVQQRRLGTTRGHRNALPDDANEQLKGSGAYEERADLVLHLDRPGLWNPTEVEDNLMKVHVGKQRDGKSRFTVDLSIDSSTMTLSEFAYHRVQNLPTEV